MNIKNIKALAEILQNSGLSLLEIEEGETKIRLEKTVVVQQTPVAVVGSAAATNTGFVAAENAEPAASPAAGAVDFNNLKEVKSPMVGVFYAAPSPDSPPFVTVGTKVKKGDILCIIEAMKLMNEIAAETDGEIVDICVQNGEVVEFGQTMFKIF